MNNKIKKKILIVDDSEMARMYHSNILNQAGYDVVCAINGSDAMEKIADQSFDMVITDINMPLLDGYSFIRTLRSEKGLKNIPVVIISTEDEITDKKIGFEAGANYYLTKPVEPEVLVENVNIFIKDY